MKKAERNIQKAREETSPQILIICHIYIFIFIVHAILLDEEIGRLKVKTVKYMMKVLQFVNGKVSF
jgi:uncharacterized protein with PQ loop repeat